MDLTESKTFLGEVAVLKRREPIPPFPDHPLAQTIKDCIKDNLRFDLALDAIFDAIRRAYAEPEERVNFIRIGEIIERWMGVWGFDLGPKSDPSKGREEDLIELLVSLRQELRGLARQKGNVSRELFILTDRIRETDLPSLGIHLEDRGGPDPPKWFFA